MPSKGQIDNHLMEGVLLMANANIELNLRCTEALKFELDKSYRYLCAPSNPKQLSFMEMTYLKR